MKRPYCSTTRCEPARLADQMEHGDTAIAEDTRKRLDQRTGALLYPFSSVASVSSVPLCSTFRAGGNEWT
jgi:hypothetical protein